MKRRKYLCLLAMPGLATTSGCINEADTALTGSREINETRVKQKAESPRWEEIFRNITEWEGDSIHYSGVEILSFIDERDGKQKENETESSGILGGQEGQEPFSVIIEHPNMEPRGDKTLYCRWDVDPFRESDVVDMWGIVSGTHTYETLTKGDLTVPEVDLVDMELSEENQNREVELY